MNPSISQLVSKIWSDIENWWVTHSATENSKGISDGVTDDQLESIEKVIGKELPEDYKSSLKIHGLKDVSINDYTYLAASNAFDRWKMMKDQSDKGNFINRNAEDMKTFPNYWSFSWFPFATDSAGNLLCVDLSKPGDVGHVGSVIAMENQDGQGPYKKDHLHTFSDWLENYLHDLQTGKYMVTDGLVEEA